MRYDTVSLLHRTHVNQPSDSEIQRFCEDLLSDLPGLTYFDLDLICTVAASSVKDLKIGAAETQGPSVHRWIPRAYNFFFHSLWYHPEGSFLLNDVISGQATEWERAALRKGELRISARGDAIQA